MRKNWDLSNVTCLVAEGGLHMRGIIRSVLSGLGVRAIHEASDGAEALEIAVDRRPDIILCEWNMKPISGGEFVRILRADNDRLLNTTPVIVVSADSKRATIDDAVQAGIHGFIAKPVSPYVLYSRMGIVLQTQELHGRSTGVAKVKRNDMIRPASGQEPTKPMALDDKVTAASGQKGARPGNEFVLP